jgi:hypothetical protein
VKLSVEQFAHEVVACGLLTASDVEPFKAALSDDKARGDASALAKKLVSAGKLTKYQAANAVQGKAKNLVFGDYVVLAAIGSGGMGQVFKAEHRRMKRVVALKILPPAAVKSPEAVKRFQQEVQAAARLEHPNIVTAHDAGEGHGVHFLVMQYVDGRDLGSLVAERGPLPVAKAVNYILQAARGLAYAHGRGVIHRDIKPANLLLNNEGTIKILDMGIARVDGMPAPATGANQPMTAVGELIGTADYMSPEQAEDAHQVDARADIYSLGCTFHFLLTGESPYSGTTWVQKVMAHRDQPVPSLTSKRPDAPPPLDRVFARMVAKRPSDRFPTMQEVIAAIEPLESLSTGKANAAWAAPVNAVTDAMPSPPAAAVADTAVKANKGTATLLDHAVVRKTWSATGKAVGALFATIIAPILVTFILKYLDKPPVDPPATVPVANGSLSATEKPLEEPIAGKKPETIASKPPLKLVAGQSADLLAAIDISRDALQGDWQIRDGPLQLATTDGKQFSLLRLPAVGFSEYDLSLTIRRLEGATNTKGGIFLAIVVDDRHQGAVLMDSDWGAFRRWGLEMIDGKDNSKNGTEVKVKPMFTTKPSEVLVKVRRGSVNVTCNGSPILNWRGNGEQLSLPSPCVVQGPPALYLVARAEFSFDEIRVTPGGGDWTPLFNDRDLNGWTGAHFEDWNADAKKSELVGTGNHPNWLYSQHDYRDFRLRLEFQMAAGTNSGIALRGSPNDKEDDNLQIELCNDPALSGKLPTGSVRNAAFDAAQGKHGNLKPLAPAKSKPLDSWNELEVGMLGTWLRVWVNGARVIETDLKNAAEAKGAVPALKRTKGRIGLQIVKGRVRFRNIVIHEYNAK